MSSTFGGNVSSREDSVDEQMDIKPDISLLCCHSLHTDNDCSNVKTEPLSDSTPTTSRYDVDVPADGYAGLEHDELDVKPLACVPGHNRLSSDDDKLNQLPLVVMKEFDVTKLVYQLPNSLPRGCKPHAIGDPLSKPYICFECGKGLRSTVEWKIHTATHSCEKSFRCTECDEQFWTQKQVVMHVMMHCPGR